MNNSHSQRMSFVISVLVLFFGIFSIYSLPDRAYSQAPNLIAAQDGFVDLNNPTANYNGKRLEVTYSNFPALVATRRSLLQWNLASGSTSLSSASLVLQLVQNSLPAGASVNLGLYALPDGWNESSVTANNEPAIGSLLQTITIASGTNGQIRFDGSVVSSYLEVQRTGDGIASFLLRLDGGSGNLGFGGHIFFEDREGTADGINGNEPFIDIPAATPTPTDTPLPATLTPTSTPSSTNTPSASNGNITIRLDAQPLTSLNFNFDGDLGTFQLRDAIPVDRKAIKTFSVAPGVYTVYEQIPSDWYLSITCSPSDSGEVTATGNGVAISVTAGQDVTCTFTNQKSVVVRAFKFDDRNGNRVPQKGEPYLSGWTFNLYNSENQLIGTQVTNNQGKISFTNVRPDTITICEVQKNGWSNTQPPTLDSTYGQPCYTLTILPGFIVEFSFGNRASRVLTTSIEVETTDGYTLIKPVDTTIDPDVYPVPVNDDEYLNTPAQEDVFDNKLYLPVVTR